MTPRPWVEAFAPATVSNLGPGFDCLGLALPGPGDRVRARLGEAPGVRLLAVSGDEGRLPRDWAKNTAGVAVAALLRRHAPHAAVELELDKGLPLGSGLGSSGASAAAAVVAVNALLDLGLGSEQLVDAAREGEHTACGAAHPDNVAPAIMGGIVLIASTEPLRLFALPVPDRLWIVTYTPSHPVETAKARAVLPARIPLGTAVQQWSRLAMLVHALHLGDIALLGEAIVDVVAEPARASLIPSFVHAKAACQEAGALATSISGAGPTTFAFCDDESRAATILQIIDEVFTGAGIGGTGQVSQVGEGARVISPPLH